MNPIIATSDNSEERTINKEITIRRIEKRRANEMSDERIIKESEEKSE